MIYTLQQLFFFLFFFNVFLSDLAEILPCEGHNMCRKRDKKEYFIFVGLEKIN